MLGNLSLTSARRPEPGHLTKVLDNKGRITSPGLNRPIGEYNNSTAK